MPDAIITSTASTFGTISGVFSADQSTISGTISGIVPGTLTGSVGVPGPAGPAGIGLPAGGTSGQFLQKTSGVDYATDWVTVNLTGLATESWVTAGFYPLTGNPSGFLTASALSPYLTSATAASTYQTLAGMSSYLTTSAAAAGYYPLSGNPSGFLTAASLSGYATESWVTGQGYITSAALTPYLTSATAASTYQTISGMSAYLTKADNLGSLTNFATARTNLGLGSLAVVNDAPSDGSQYARKNGAWDVVSVPASYITSVSSPLSVTTGNLSIDLSAYAPLASPLFTGDARAVTPAFGDNDTSIATTAFVQSALAGGTAVARNLEVEVRNQSGSTIPAGSIVYISGATGNKPLITLAQANNDTNSAQTIGFVKTSIANNGTGFVIIRGELENIDTSALTEGVQLYLSPTTAGAWTTTKPSAPQHLVYVGICVRSHPTLGTILVAVQNGYELDELHDVAIASKANNDLLAYESSTNLWKNKSFGTLGLLTSSSLSGYAQLSGATFTGIVGFNGASGGIAAKSTGWFKAYTSGSESTDYSLQYDTGFQVVVGGTTVARLGATGILAPSSGITFSDASVQTSAGITAATAASTYYPLTGNPSSFLVAADIAGKADLASPALTGNVTITSNSTGAALFIEQSGTGNILTLHDQAADTTFVAIDQNGKINTIPSVTASAGFNVPHGTAPTTPVNGDIWTTTGGLFMRQNGSTRQYVDFDGTQTINGSKTFSNANNTFGNSTAAGTTNIASGATISGATKAVNLGTSGVAGSTTNITIGSTTGTSTTTLQGITNGVTQSAGDNTTKLATTAFVTAAVPATATHLQSLQFAASSFAKVSDNGSQVIAPSILHVWPSPSNYNGTATSGAGASAALYLTGYILTSPSAGVAGSARAYHGNIAGDLAGMLWGGSGANVINFSRRVSMAFRFAQYPSDNNSVTRVLLGKIHGTAVGDLTTRGIGVKYVPSGGGFYFYLQVHNGTTLTNVVGSTQYAGGVADLEVVSDGAGNATLYLNGASIATSTAAPTGQTGANATVFAEIESTASTTVQTSATIGRLYVNSNNF